MIKNILKVIFLFFFVIGSAFGRTQTGQVTQVIVRSSDGLIYFFLSTTPDGKPACATQPYFMIKDETSAAGKQQLALLMQARATGQAITVIGTGACGRWPDGEDVLVIML